MEDEKRINFRLVSINKNSRKGLKNQEVHLL